jgi:hypothetical protein
MASAQEPGVMKFYRITPTNSKIFIFGANIAALGPSGSADGVIQSTPEKWLNVPIQKGMNGEKVLRVNDKLLVTFTAFGADTTDASDCEFSIPITYRDGSSDVLGSPDDSTVWDSFVLGDVALVANKEYPVCEKVVRQEFALGGGKIFASIEDDTG